MRDVYTGGEEVPTDEFLALIVKFSQQN